MGGVGLAQGLKEGCKQASLLAAQNVFVGPEEWYPGHAINPCQDK